LNQILNCLKFVRPGNGYPGPNFPLSGKVVVNGPNAHPLFQWLKERAGHWEGWTDHTWLHNTGAKTLATTKGADSDVPWNFRMFSLYQSLHSTCRQVRCGPRRPHRAQLLACQAAARRGSLRVH